MGIGGHQPTFPNQTPNTVKTILGVSLWVITFIGERETAQTVS
jgi:hypothetical protein